ncbi:MAG: UDP-N-acetylmuramate dehydrogenase [Deltaproteobacteria bacterium]|nr:UDP-N-acetylmuramate dehydrogenase [Deltaproteobacteria bacterium]
MRRRSGVSLAPYTTLGVGGPAAHFLEADDEADVREALVLASERELPIMVLGGGSNLLVADRGYHGIVLRLGRASIDADERGEAALVRVSAGTPWDALVAWSVERGYAGLECLSGIPGDVGAAPMQNIGAYGAEVGPSIRSVEVVSRATGEASSIAAEACGFGYRESVFKAELAERYVVVGVTLGLSKGPPRIAYAELERALAGNPSPSLAEVRAAVLAVRRAKSMVLDATDPDARSAGSFFVNPTLSPDDADRVLERARARGVSDPMPRFGHGAAVKLSAGWLIERAGLAKGTRRGAVGLSTKHCLALVTAPGATAVDVVAFASEVRARVRDAFGVRLSPEPRAYGFEGGELDGLYG